jgi:formylglycine-generating enzyme required for sulfatase activity
MRRWFLSFHSSDRALAERLKVSIEGKDADSRVFFDATSLRAGGFWQPALAEGIDEADAFVLLVGEKGAGPWQTLEYYEALDKRAKSSKFPVVLMLLDGHAAPGLPFLRQLHWIVSADPASEKDVARLFDAASGSGTRPGELWRYTSPYRGLTAMEEKDSDYFFGRKRETVEVLSVLADAPNSLPVLLGNSGVGKSSVAQAGVLAALKRQAWPEDAGAPPAWPPALRGSRKWCFLTLRPGADPLKALVEPFLQTWQHDTTDPAWEERRSGWIDRLLDGKATLPGLLDAAERRYAELGQPHPPAFFLYVDQGEELYVRAEERRQRRFSELLAAALPDPRLHVMMSMRTDFLGGLQNDAPLFNARRQIDVPPLREAALREVVSRPAELLSARFETARLVDIITRRTAEDSIKDVGALPLLSYTLDDMWKEMVRRGDGTLLLPAQSFELGGVLVDRANTFLAAHPGDEAALRRMLTLRLATVRDDGEPTRRRASRSEFSPDEWRLVTALADYPYRLLVTVTPAAGETHAEVAHEAIFRRWNKLREWIAAEREFLAWRNGIEAAHRAWTDTPDGAKNEALLMGFPLAQAQGWLAQRAEDLSGADREFVELSIKRDAADRSQREGMRRRTRQMGALAGMLLIGIGAGLAWSSRAYFKALAVVGAETVWPKVLTAEAEHALQPGQGFKECADCPEMVVVPTGEFLMGSPKEGQDHQTQEEPQHKVSIKQRFAVSRFEVTFEEWDACVTLGGCAYLPSDQGWGRGTRPVINVNWNDAQQYVAWLSKRIGKSYRLLSEAEWEYAARAGSDKSYSWGDEIGKGNANCSVCGSQWDFKQTAPVGAFAANAFGLHDMHGNVFEWTQDCLHNNYSGAPEDSSAWTVGGNCDERVIRGGAWYDDPQLLRAAFRSSRNFTVVRDTDLGFRLARTLNP